ncbi:MAG TPA: sugar ABC transporter ATP-binding protein [Bauldia sp.]|nr:sugar ABC transporter ATP-binding protein [Bauldia sp.]
MVRRLSKRYGNVQALAEVDFELGAGEVMALLGENGAGKSTLVKVLSGLVHPDSGTIEIDGRVTDLFPSARSQAAGVAVVHQEYSSVPTMTVAENLVLGQAGVPALWWPGTLNARARKLLATVGLDHLDPRTVVEQLSVAEKQLLEIARLLVRDARILIFDEPTAALADREIERVLAVIRRLAGEGRSVIYVTHRLPEVFRIADRVTVFRNGRSLPARPTSELDVDAVITMMLGRDLDTMFPDRGTLGKEPLLRVEALLAEGLSEPVSFTVRPGEIVGLTGQLGSGASSVIEALAGVLPPQAGRVLLDGSEIPLRSRAATLSRGIAYCSADRKRDGIFAERPIRENLSSPWIRSVASGGIISPRRERDKAREIAARFAIDVKRLGSAVGTLSGGNQQKVAVGKWLGTQPKIMLLDEPTRGVDIGARAEIYQRLRDLCAAGLGIIVASSDTAEVLGLSDTIATFYRGRLTGMRPQAEWTEDALIREVMHQEAAA